MNKIQLFEDISKSIEALEVSSISEVRKETLQPLIDYLKERLNTNRSIRLNFICTHNSRRSHLSQIWAQTMAEFYNIKQVSSYSGGTEATALFPMVAETLKGQGFKIKTLSQDKNPIYSIKYADNEPAIIGFSKTYASADKGCPFVAGSDKRIPITYLDPKVSDGTPQQRATYLERSIQIATEMKFVFGALK